MRQLPFPANVENYINSESHFVFVDYNMICEKPSSYYIFPLLFKYVCKTSLVKRKITQNEHTTSIKEMKLYQSNERKKENSEEGKKNTQ